MSPGKLSSAILEHHEFLIEDQTLSEIALLLRDAVPNIFVEVLVSLIKSDIYSLQVSYLMLQGVQGQTFMFQFTLADRNMQVRFSLKVVWEF